MVVANMFEVQQNEFEEYISSTQMNRGFYSQRRNEVVKP
jgi:hypothetical protein